MDKDRIPMSVDEGRYAAGYEQGQVHIVTARHDGKLVGYFIFFVISHMHYKTSGPMGYVDMYYILKEHRSGGTGAKLLMLAESSLKAMRGVSKIYLSCKIHQDHDQLFQALGYKPTDRVYTKFIGS